MEVCAEWTGKTVEEAVSTALGELKATEEDVNIEVIDEGNKGIFGIIGSRLAKVIVSKKETRAQMAYRFLTDILEKMGISAEVELEETESSIVLKLKSEDIGVIIGRRGETLDSLQYILNLVVNRFKGDYKRIVIDVENYRKKREDTLINLANRLAEKVIKYKKSITLEPMSSYERRIIHYALQNNKKIETYSVGNEPNRKVVIRLS